MPSSSFVAVDDGGKVGIVVVAEVWGVRYDPFNRGRHRVWAGRFLGFWLVVFFGLRFFGGFSCHRRCFFLFRGTKHPETDDDGEDEHTDQKKTAEPASRG